ncbi:MAG: histidine triad nucleotide-binding protein [Peptoniphilaceae bacterium]|nr:histidine triad nucleotide-binding protein [Peptoniphilaceae bacterium]MDY4196995.1 histidine triad nucleotide-binding protein [Peptoniphilaceae bacterium]
MSDCIFCKLANKEIPTETVYEDDQVFAFRDMNPKAEVHYLFIPKKHIQSVNDFEHGEDAGIVAAIFRAIARVAERDGFADSGYRIINNCGKDGGQSVPHLHFHVLAKQPIRFAEFDQD